MNRPQTRPMPENTADQIVGLPDDEFSEIREEGLPKGGILEAFASAIGISPAKLATALGGALPGKSKLNATCKCGKRYKYFSDDAYQEDQSTCPACRDKAMEPIREAAMRPEKLAAATRLRQEEAKVAEKKDDERKELVTLVAETIAQLQKSKAA